MEPKYVVHLFKQNVGKTSFLTWIKLHKRPCKVYHVSECYKHLFNSAQGHNIAISQENQNDSPMPYHALVQHTQQDSYDLPIGQKIIK